MYVGKHCGQTVQPMAAVIEDEILQKLEELHDEEDVEDLVLPECLAS